MSQLPPQTILIDESSSRQYTGFPLNSTLVNSYTLDTIRGIITQAAAGQPYSMPVWIRIDRVGINVSAQDYQIARTRTPVFIPIDRIHDIYMLPSINNVICIVYDEVQSNSKGVLLYVVYPSDAQFIRDDFRSAKQLTNPQLIPEQQPLNVSASDASAKVIHRNAISVRKQSPRRPGYGREKISNTSRDLLVPEPSISYTPYRNGERDDGDYRYAKTSRSKRREQSPSKYSSDNRSKPTEFPRSHSLDKRNQPKLPNSSSSEIAQQQQLLLLQQQQQQMAAWQASQKSPALPLGVYNRYVPKTIPLATGEVLKTTLARSESSAAVANGLTMAYIEPQQPSTVNSASFSVPSQARNTVTSPEFTESTRHRHHRHRRYPNNDNVSSRANPTTHRDMSQPSRFRSANPRPITANTSKSDNDDETKEYLQKLIEQMQALKSEMDMLRRSNGDASTKRSDSIQFDLKEIRSNIDHIRARIAMTPRRLQN